jgi:CheY-like chemotaxis protein
MTVKLLDKLAGVNSPTMKEVENVVSKVNAWCNNIIVSSKHIRDILDNVPDLSKLEAGTLQLSKQHIKVSELSSEIRLLLTPTMRAGVLFTIEVIPANLEIVGDRQRWKQLLANLLSNAIKFTHEGEVKLQISEGQDQSLLVQVCDTGVGIREKEQMRLFHKYEQVKSNSETEKGTGLGLVIAQRIATRMGAHIQIESPWSPQDAEIQAPNAKPGGAPLSKPVYVKVVLDDGSTKIRGTRFYFAVGGQCVVEEGSLPLKCETESVAEAALKDGLRFLVVDDDVLNRMIMCAKLRDSDEFKKHQFEVHEASVDEEVSEKVKEKGLNYFDFILMDEHLGEESKQGSELTQQLRNDGCTSVIIACSGNCLEEDEELYKRKGASWVWPKPYPTSSEMSSDLLRFSALEPSSPPQGVL